MGTPLGRSLPYDDRLAAPPVVAWYRSELRWPRDQRLLVGGTSGARWRSSVNSGGKGLNSSCRPGQGRRIRKEGSVGALTARGSRPVRARSPTQLEGNHRRGGLFSVSWDFVLRNSARERRACAPTCAWIHNSNCRKSVLRTGRGDSAGGSGINNSELLIPDP